MQTQSFFAPKPILIGAGIALSLVALFLAGADSADPSWHALWWVRPLVIVPLAGATGGFCYNVLHRWQQQRHWHRGLILLVSLFLFIVGLWLGFVLGFNGTYWN